MSLFLHKNLALQDTVIKIIFGLGLVANIIGWYLVVHNVLRIKSALPFLSLHYTIYSGVDWVGPWFYIFIYPLLSSLVLIFNFWHGSRVYSRDRLLSYFLAASALVFQILLGIFIIFLLSINIQAR